MHSKRRQAAVDAGHPEWIRLPVNRQRAIASGEDWFFVGKALSCGHTAPRSVSLKVRCVVCSGYDPDCFAGLKVEQSERKEKPSAMKALRAEKIRSVRRKRHVDEFAKYLKWEAALNDVVRKVNSRANSLNQAQSSWKRLYFKRNCKGSDWLALPRTNKEARLDPAANSYFDGLPCSGCSERAPKAVNSGVCRNCNGTLDWVMCSAFRKRNAGERLDLLSLPIKPGKGIYFSGSLCLSGHVSARASHGACLVCNSESWGKRRVDIERATPPWLCSHQIEAIQAIYLDAASQDTPHEVDHIIPLNHPNVCGLHVPWNLRALSLSDNRKKGNRFDGTMENESWRVGSHGERASAAA